MSSMDLGIDLGTATIVIYLSGKGIVLREPSVVAINAETGALITAGSEAYNMLGKAPGNIRVAHPLSEGVISDYKLTHQMIKFFLKKVLKNNLVKPRVTICVPSKITGVESKAVIDAAVLAGARQVHLIEEPVAAAIGAGIDVSRPEGVLVVDIGGGTTDIAIISLNGIVCKTSLRVAGNRFDREIISYVRSKYDVLIGERTAEKIKIKIASLYYEDPDLSIEAKGRNLITGLPQKIIIKRGDLYPVIVDIAEQITQAILGVLEKTPPELSGDIFSSGALMTGGGALLHGLDAYISNALKIRTRIAENPVECVAIGTGKSFDYLETLFDGLVNPATHAH